jgi:hypothetical protein
LRIGRRVAHREAQRWPLEWFPGVWVSWVGPLSWRVEAVVSAVIGYGPCPLARADGN